MIDLYYMGRCDIFYTISIHVYIHRMTHQIGQRRTIYIVQSGDE